jgi:hypothetical protein
MDLSNPRAPSPPGGGVGAPLARRPLGEVPERALVEPEPRTDASRAILRAPWVGTFGALRRTVIRSRTSLGCQVRQTGAIIRRRVDAHGELDLVEHTPAPRHLGHSPGSGGRGRPNKEIPQSPADGDRSHQHQEEHPSQHADQDLHRLSKPARSARHHRGEHRSGSDPRRDVHRPVGHRGTPWSVVEVGILRRFSDRRQVGVPIRT